MSNLNDLPLVTAALQAMCPAKIEPKVMTKKRYSIRRPGCTSWADTNSWNRAQLKLLQANQICPGHIIVDNAAPRPAKPAPSALWDYHDGPVSREDALAWRERELGDMKSKFDREDSAL